MGKIQILDTKSDYKSALRCAVYDLLKNKNVALPTETVYGLAGRISNLDAIESIFILKNRPLTDPLIIHIFDKSWIKKYAKLTTKQAEVFLTLADAFWPGPLSVVVEANDSVPEIVRAGSPTVALRSPSNPFFLDVLKNLGEGIAAPSANQFGHISPTSARDVAEEFSESDLLVCDAGDCDVGIESTVLRVYKDGQMRILRPGRVTQSAIEVALSNFETLFSDGFWKSKEQSLALNLKTVGAESPGQLVKHYAPKQDTYLVSKSVENAGGSDCLGKQLALEKTVIIDFDSEFLYAKNKFLKYLNPAPKGDLNQFMRSLFSELRRAEKVSEAETILIYFPKEFYDQRSIAISDRLRRASSGKTAVWELSSGRARVFSSTL